MSKYTIVPRVRQPGFKVEIEGTDGSRNTMLGFETEEQAADWVAASRRQEGLSEPGGGD
ncbi:MAG: hypothetical protein J0H19_21375 [Rhodospirillales bacterium]|jgi:hypothetical protein|nr:hypothetical protein [Rhodospirillales bacterium]MBN8929163.1 hypothetical protein [Rhodospirillales bacterium]